jgi:hypothetical protein
MINKFVICSEGDTDLTFRQAPFASNAGKQLTCPTESFYACFCRLKTVGIRYGVLRLLIRLTSGRLVGH